MNIGTSVVYIQLLFTVCTVDNYKHNNYNKTQARTRAL